MPSDAHKDVIRRWIAFASGGFRGAFDEYLTPDYVGHLGDTDMDRQELERLEREFVAAFPDARYIIDDLLAEDDRVAMRVTTRGTHRGAYAGTAPTHRSVEFTSMVIYRIHDGRIAESWGEIDLLRLMRQLRTP